MDIERLKKEELKSIELMNILNKNNIKFTYDTCYGGFIIHDSKLEEFKTVCQDNKELEDYINETLNIYRCYSCNNLMEEYTYSVTLNFKDGDVVILDSMYTGLTENDMTNIENDIRKIHKDIDNIEFGELCPHCLTCM